MIWWESLALDQDFVSGWCGPIKRNLEINRIIKGDHHSMFYKGLGRTICNCACFLPVVNGDWLSNHSWSLFLLSSHLFKKLGSVIILTYLTGVLTDISPLIGRLHQLISDETRFPLIFGLTLRLISGRSCVIYVWKSRVNFWCQCYM